MSLQACHFIIECKRPAPKQEQQHLLRAAPPLVQILRGHLFCQLRTKKCLGRDCRWLKASCVLLMLDYPQFLPLILGSPPCCSSIFFILIFFERLFVVCFAVYPIRCIWIYPGSVFVEIWKETGWDWLTFLLLERAEILILCFSPCWQHSARCVAFNSIWFATAFDFR